MAEDSERNDTTEIPFARRINPSRESFFLRFRYRLLGYVFLTLASVFVAIELGLNDNNFYAKKGSNIPQDGLLLGHFPYPEASTSDLMTVYPGLKVHKDVFTALNKLRKAAASEGIKLVVLSGYRSIDLQEEIFYENKSIRNQIAVERAKVSAPPGYSEHSTGYAIDFGDATMRETDFEVEFENTPAYLWLERNAPKFHFVLSFPKGNSQGVSYEPWHWRYEGTVDALRQFEPANRKRKGIRNK